MMVVFGSYGLALYYGATLIANQVYILNIFKRVMWYFEEGDVVLCSWSFTWNDYDGCVWFIWTCSILWANIDCKSSIYFEEVGVVL